MSNNTTAAAEVKQDVRPNAAVIAHFLQLFFPDDARVRIRVLPQDGEAAKKAEGEARAKAKAAGDEKRWKQHMPGHLRTDNYLISSRMLRHVDGDGRTQFERTFANEHRAVYFQVNLADKPIMRHTTKKDRVTGADVEHEYESASAGNLDITDLTVAAFGDWDRDKEFIAAGATPEERAEREQQEKDRLHSLAKTLKTHVMAPTFVIHSGNGIQAFWLLKTPVAVTEESVDDFRQMMANVAATFPGVDPAVKDLARVMRAPGGINAKPGRVPRVASLIHGHNGITRRYTLSDLLASPDFKVGEVTQDTTAVGKANASALRDHRRARGLGEPRQPVGVKGTHAAPAIAEALGVDLSKLVDRLTKDPNRLGSLWRDGKSCPYWSRGRTDFTGSAFRFALAMRMADAGYSAEEFHVAAWAHVLSHGVNPITEKRLDDAYGEALARSGRNCGDSFDVIDEDDEVVDLDVIDDDDDLTIEAVARTHGQTVDDLKAEADDFGEDLLDYAKALASNVDLTFIKAQIRAERTVERSKSAPVDRKPTKPERRPRIELEYVKVEPMRIARAAANILAEFRDDVTINAVNIGGTLFELMNRQYRGVDRNGAPVVETAPGMTEMVAARLKEMCEERIAFYVMAPGEDDKPKKEFIAMPGAVAEFLRAPANVNGIPFKVASGHSEGPVIRSDGSLFNAVGFDDVTGLWCGKAHDLGDLSERPTRAQAEAALAELTDLLAEFPMAGEDDEERALNRSVALAGMMTCAVRAALPNAPMLCVDASTPGTGKSELSLLMAAFATAAPTAMQTTGHNEEEFSKRMDTIVLSQPTVTVLDNVSTLISGDTIKAMLTSERMEVRVLGESRKIATECRFPLIANGNNLSLHDDLGRRAIICRLDAGMERPEQRSFSHNPVGDVRANRAHYVRQVATVIRAYLAAGDKPGAGLAGYEPWFRTVCAPLIWLGLPNPVRTQEAIAGNDPVRNTLGVLLEAWHGCLGDQWVSAAQLAEIAEGRVPDGVTTTGDVDGGDDDKVFARTEHLEPLRQVLSTMMVNPNPKTWTRSIGNHLRAMKGRRENGFALIRTKKDTLRIGGVQTFGWQATRAN